MTYPCVKLLRMNDAALLNEMQRLPDWGVGWSLLDDDEYGWADHETRTIWLDVRLTHEEDRSTVAVEVERALRPWLSDCELEHLAARRLLPIARLAAAVGFAYEPEVAACILGVDMQLLTTRIVGLTVGEWVTLILGGETCDCMRGDCWLSVG